MIITRSPLRISIFGGGTDLINFYSQHGSKFISLAIDKYVYSVIHNPFEQKYFLKYRQSEVVNDVSLIKNELLKSVLLSTNTNTPLEISTMADIPYGSGLGSSGAYISSLVHALSKNKNLDSKLSRYKLAKLASKIETSHFDNKNVGLQDTYASIFGGLKLYSVDKSGKVSVKNLLSHDDVNAFTNNLSLYFTNKTRKTTNQNSKLHKNNQQRNLLKVKEIAIKGKKAIQDKDHNVIGDLLYKQWLLKYERQPSSFHKKINFIIEECMEEGALGGKLIGAGGGGFVLIYTKRKNNKKIEKIMESNEYKKINFNADHSGTDLFQI